MASPAAILSILVKTEGAQATAAQLTAVDKAASRSHKTFSALGAAAKSTGIALGVGGLTLGLKRSVDEFREAQKVGNQTNAVLKSTGGIANVTAKEVGNLANAISKKAGIDDEAIQKGENLLLTFKNVRNEAGRGRDIFNQATQAAVDLSAAGFGSLETTSKQLGKALNDPVKGLTALGRAGVTFSAQQKSAITALMDTGKAADRVKAQQIVLREVMSQVGGSAAAQATSTDKLRVTIGNLEESIGSHLIPTMDAAARVMIAIIGFFEKNRTAATALGVAVATLTAAWVGYKVATMAAAVATTVATGGLNLIIPLVAALAAGLVVLYTRSKTFREIVASVANTLKTVLGAAIRFVLGAFSSVLTGISKVARALGKDGLADKAAAGARAIDDLRDSLKAVPDKKNVDVSVKITLDGQSVDVSKAKPLSPTPPGGDGPGVIGSKIASKVRSNAGVRKAAAAAATFVPGFGAAPGKPSSSLRGANSALGPFARIGARFGLGVSSGSRPGSITSSGNISYHSSGEAIDMANGRGPDAAKLAFFKYMKSRYGSRLAELIYTPGGPGIKNGRSFTYTGQVARDHYDHVHVAMDLGKPGVGIGDAFGRAGAFMGDGMGDVAALARQAGFRGQALITAIAVAGAESGFRSHASNRNTNGSIDRGYWQINSVHGSQSTFSPTGNARAAFSISSGGRNWHPWVTYNTGAYRRYLNQARAAAGSISGSATKSKTGGATSTAGSGAASAVAKVNPLDQKLAGADLAIEQAKRFTPGPGSPFFATRSTAQIAAMTAKRKIIGARIRKIRAALKGHLTPATRLRLTQELTQRLQEHAQLGTDVQGLRHPAATDTGATVGGGDTTTAGDGADPNQALIDSNTALQASIDAQAEAAKAQAEALDAARAELKRQTDFATSVQNTSNFQLTKSLADLLSGQIVGYGVAGRKMTPGNGVEYSY